MSGEAAGIVVAMKKAKEIMGKFVAKGATSPEKALTIEELGLNKRLVFHIFLFKRYIVDVGDKYYFDVEKYNDRAAKKFHDFVADLFKDLKE